ncbi:MAG: hypothetical protein ACFE9R_12405 [Candidatus Hermodarchaeota archaeon]
MSSGEVSKRFVGEIFHGITPESALETKDDDFLNLIVLNEIESITILNPSYQKAVKIHQILHNNKELSNEQKLEFCTLGRYFMKKYLKEIVRKLK